MQKRVIDLVAFFLPSYHLKDTNRPLEQTERRMSQRLGSEAGKAGDRSGR